MTAAGSPLRRTRFEERHRATADAVVESQRGRIIEGILEAVARKGYPATTLTDIVARARVSRSTFYEHFADKQECFLTAIDACTALIRTRLFEEVRRVRPSDARGLIQTVISTYCESMAAEPDFTKVIFAEAFNAGPAAVARRDAAAEEFATMYREFYRPAREERPELAPIDDDLFRLIPDAIAERTRRQIIAGKLEELPALEGMFIAFAYRVLGLNP